MSHLRQCQPFAPSQETMNHQGHIHQRACEENDVVFRGRLLIINTITYQTPRSLYIDIR